MTSRRGRWLLAAKLFVLIVALCAVPAQAIVKCTVTDYRSCGRCICCLLTCIDCYDSVTGDSSSDCTTTCSNRCV
jgi:hypothetical protein